MAKVDLIGLGLGVFAGLAIVAAASAQTQQSDTPEFVLLETLTVDEALIIQQGLRPEDFSAAGVAEPENGALRQARNRTTDASRRPRLRPNWSVGVYR